MTGALTGVGYDYDDVWGGRLNEKRMPELLAARSEAVAA
jgi:hypothetical protein